MKPLYLNRRKAILGLFAAASLPIPSADAANRRGNDYATGLIASDPKEVARMPQATLILGADGRKSIPTNVNFRDGLPPVGDQGGQGSCAAWASAYYCCSYEVGQRLGAKREQMATDEYQFSPAFIYNQRRNTAISGMALSEAVKILVKSGCARMSAFSYHDDREAAISEDVRDVASYFSVEGGYPLWLRQAPDSGPLNLEKLRAYLAFENMPLVVGAYVPPSFKKASRDVIFHGPSEQEVRQSEFGLHAMTIVGYDKGLEAFLLVNSWGKKWGDDGFLWVSEAYIKNFTSEIWAIRAGGPMALGLGKAKKTINQRGDIEIRLVPNVTK